MNDDQGSKHGVQSLEVGMRVLRAMADGERAMMLKDIAAAAGMAPSKAHRYLVSFIRAGLVEQDPATARYDLGAFALQLGLVALDRIDRIRLGLDAITALRDTINETTALAVWTPQGAVVARWERPRRPIVVNVLTGTALGLLDSAAGRVFGAWLPSARTDALLQAAVAAGRGASTLPAARALLDATRARGYSHLAAEHQVGGIEAAAAPVFNFRNDVTMALIVVGVAGSIDLGASSPALTALRDAAAQLSARLGARAD